MIFLTPEDFNLINRVVPSAGLPGTLVTVYINSSRIDNHYDRLFFGGNQEMIYQKVVPGSYFIGVVPPGAQSGQIKLYHDALGAILDDWFACQPPQISQVNPDRIIAGRTLTIYGDSFGQPQGDGSVYIGDTQLLVKSWEMKKIVALVPIYAVSGDLVVTSPIGVSNKRGVTVVASGNTASLITTIDPPEAPYNTTVTITGSNFKPYSSTTSYITVGDVRVTDYLDPSKWTDTSIKFLLSSVDNMESGDLVVHTDEGESNAVFWKIKPVQVRSVSSLTAPSGSVVTISATNLGKKPGKVYIGSYACAIRGWYDSLGRVDVTIPPGAPEGNLRIANRDDFVDVGYYKATKSAAPEISTVSPSSGGPLTAITIEGANFNNPVDSVTVAGKACSNIVATESKITCQVPADVTTGNVIVSCANGTATGPIFTAVSPVITELLPSEGDYEQSEEIRITIKGQNFPTQTGVIRDVYYGSASLSVAAADWLSSGEVNITLLKSLHTTSDYIRIKSGANFSNSVLFVIKGTRPPESEAPVLTELIPNSGISGDVILIRGDKLEQSGKLYVGAQEVTPISWADTEIKFTIPPSFTTSAVYIENNKGRSNSLTLYADYTDTGSGGAETGTGDSSTALTAGPAFTFTPVKAFVGERVTIVAEGTGFGDYPGDVLLRGAIPMHVLSWTDTEIVAEVPEDGETGNISLVTDNWISRGSVLKVYADSQALVDEQFGLPTADKPHVLAVSPTYGAAGDTILLTGVNFGDLQGTLTLGGVSQDATILTWSDAAITFSVAEGSKTGNISVTTTAGESNSAYFTVISGHPVITRITPPTAVVPQQIQISGEHFGGAKGRVLIGDTLYSEIPSESVRWSNSKIIADIPSSIDFHAGFVQIITADIVPSNLYPYTIDGVSTAPSTRLSYKDIRNYTGQLVAEASHVLEAFKNLPAGSGTVDHLDVELLDGHPITEYRDLLNRLEKEATDPMSVAYVKPNKAGSIKMKRRGYIDIKHDKANHKITISLKDGSDKDVVYTSGFCEVNGICRVISATAQKPGVTVADLIKEIVGIVGVKTFMSDGADGKEVTMNIKFGTTEDTAARGDHSHKDSAPKYYAE